MSRAIFWFLIAAVVIGYWYLLIDGSAGKTVSARIEIAELRDLSQSIPGPAPTDIVAYVTAIDRRSGNLMVAGSGIQAPRIASMGYAINYSGRPAVIIDTGMTKAAAKTQDVGRFAAARRRELDRRMDEAETIVLTGTGPYFASGLKAADRSRMEGRIMLGHAQAKALAIQMSSDEAALSDDGPTVVSPGIVSIPAPGFDAGSRMVYVRLLNGRELLFTGNNAVDARAWKRQRPPARLMTDFMDKRDRGAIIGWLAAIADLKRQAPDLIIIPGRDIAALADEFERSDGALGILRYGAGQPGVFTDPNSD